MDVDRQTNLTVEPIDADEVLAQVRDVRHGAEVLFVGIVRNHHHGRAVAAITYTSYEAMAESRIAEIIEDAEKTTGSRVAIRHRLGRLEAGEASVAIAVSAPHRAEGYELNRTLLERLKSEVPIWKLEHYDDGTDAWREEESLRSREVDQS